MAFKQIVEGFKNLFGEDDIYIEEVAQERMDICSNCPYNSKNQPDHRFRPDQHCLKCGCTLPAKVRSMNSSCPIGKWGPVE